MAFDTVHVSNRRIFSKSSGDRMLRGVMKEDDQDVGLRKISV
jgi:hypothetical protein